MSQMFDSLVRAKGAVPGLDLQALTGEDPAAHFPGEPPAASADANLRPAPASPMLVLPTAVPVQGEWFSQIKTAGVRLQNGSPALPFDRDHWQANEQYRIIRTKLLQNPRKPRVILISSAGAGDGKTITSINVAAVISLKDAVSVLLIDGDFRRSSVHHHLDLPDRPGLSEVLAGTATLTDAIVRTRELPNLFVLPAGKAEENPGELLESDRFPELMAEVRSRFAYVIIDTPPIAAVADYDLIQNAADGVVMVVRPDHTNRGLCRNALNVIPKDKLIGVVLNCASEWFLTKSYGYGYGSYYSGKY